MTSTSLKMNLLAELEANQVDYGWATDSVIEVCQLNPAIRTFLIKAPAHTEHYVALCLLGLKQHARGRAKLRDLAERIATENRRSLLSECWGRDFGSTRILNKFCAGVFPKAYYLMLMDCLADPLRRACFNDVGVIYHLLIERIAKATPEHLARYTPIMLANFGGPTLEFLTHGLMRLRPDIGADHVLARINALKSASGMNRLIEALTNDMSVPKPIWAGTSTIIPLQRRADFKATGLLMRNCMNSIDIWLEGLTQRRVFYLCDGKEPAVAALQRYNLFDTWFLQDISGRENKALSSERMRQITETFARAGFLHPDELVLGGMRLAGL